MGKHYTIALNGPFIGAALTADYPVNFTGSLNVAVPNLSISAACPFGLSLRCSISLRTAMLRHPGGHVSQYPDPFDFANFPVNYGANHNVAHTAAYTVFFNQ